MDDSIAADDADDILTRLGLTKLNNDEWQVPSHRADLQRSADLIEEVARVHGLDKVPSRIGGHAG